MVDRLIRLSEVMSQSGKPKASIYRGIKEGTFPAPYPIGAHSVAWLESEIQAWIAKQVAARSANVRSGRQLASTAA